MVRLCAWTLIHTVYRVDKESMEHIPRVGAAVLVCCRVVFFQPSRRAYPYDILARLECAFIDPQRTADSCKPGRGRGVATRRLRRFAASGDEHFSFTQIEPIGMPST